MNRSAEEVRRQLEARLTHPVPQEVWDYLASQDFDWVPAAMRGEPDGMDALEEECRKLERIRGGTPPSSLPQVPHRLVALRKTRGRDGDTATSERREAVLSMIMASRASQDEELASFRQDVLGKRLLRAAEVEGWIKNVARNQGRATTWVKAPVEWTWKPKRKQIRRRVMPFDLNGARLNYEMLRYLSVDGEVRGELTTAEGVLERLRRLSERLAARYGWSEAAATSFILSGETPLCAAIRYRVRTSSTVPARTRLVLEIDPALPPPVVAAFYREVRRSLVKRVRSLSAKHLRLAQFSVESPVGSWVQRMAAWNRNNPNHRYDVVGLFRRDCERAVERLVRPPYRDIHAIGPDADDDGG